MSLFVAGNATAVCNPNMAESTPTARFHNNADGTMVDTKTGLVWRRCPLDYILGDGGTPADMTDDSCTVGGTPLNNWSNALVAANILIYPSGSLAGVWRLPNANEMSSIIERRCTPETNEVVFPNTPSAIFWTSTTDADDNSLAWHVDFSANGRVSNSGAKNVLRNAYAVRGGP